MKIKMFRTRGPYIKGKIYEVTDSFGLCQLKAGAAERVPDDSKVDPPVKRRKAVTKKRNVTAVTKAKTDSISVSEEEGEDCSAPDSVQSEDTP